MILFENVSICSLSPSSELGTLPIANSRDAITTRFEELSKEGYRVIAVANREYSIDQPLRHQEETGMIFILAYIMSAEWVKSWLRRRAAQPND